jgi:hypothetical protein
VAIVVPAVVFDLRVTQRSQPPLLVLDLGEDPVIGLKPLLAFALRPAEPYLV